MSAPQPAAKDPIRVDAQHYKVEFENSRVRVLRTTYGPHEKSVMHTHPALIGVMLTGGHARFTMPDGQVQEVELKPGEVMSFDATEHLPENIGDTTFEAILVELK